MDRPTSLTFWRVLLAITLLLTLLALLQIRSLAINMGFSLTQPKWLALIATVSIIGLTTFLFLFLSWSRYQCKVISLLKAVEKTMRVSKIATGLLLLLSLPFFSILVLHPYVGTLLGNQAWIRFLAFWLVSLFNMLAINALGKQINWPTSLVTALLLEAIILVIATSIPEVSNYPFSLSYSDTIRYYDASLVFAKQIYGRTVPLSTINPSLYLLSAIPFISPDLPIWVHRAWQVILMLSLTGGTAICLAKRLTITRQRMFWLFSAWTFLFLFQGPVYFHLLIPVLIILGFVSTRHFWRSLLVVIVASIWAGISRINWFPIPGLLAAVLYLLEVPVGHGPRRLLAYLWKPASWFIIGSLTSFISQSLYITWSGNGDRRVFFSSLASDLLWYRLLPNATYPPGILLGILFTSLPVFLILFWIMRDQLKLLHSIRFISISAVLGTLFTGGLVVSVKIGGGADLHNMDAYLILLLILSGYGLFGLFTPDETDRNTIFPNRILYLPWSLVVFALIVPIWFVVQSGEPIIPRNIAQANLVLQEINNRSQEVVQNGGEVLFISERHLLTFQFVEGVPLVPDYEKEFLMEMVMSHNREYLNQFYYDLQQHRFDLIIVNPQTSALLGSKYRFGEENNMWVLKVTKPLLCEYYPIETFPDEKIQILVPRTDGSACP